jgi:mono/diheme cytochrome c family protein
MILKLAAIGFVGIISLAFVLPLASQEKQASNSNLPIPRIAGKQLYFGKNCNECHTLGDKAEGEKTPVKTTREEKWFAGHVAEHSEIILRKDRSKRRQRRTAREEVMMLKAWLEGATPDEKKQIDAMPENVFKGAYLFAQNKCLNCHTVAGYGKDVGPELTKVGNEHDHEWFVKNMIDPKQFAPDTEMPSFEDLPKEALNQIAAYLGTLK